MRRPLTSLVLLTTLLLPVASSSPAVAAPLWRIPNADLLGFTPDGSPITRTLDPKTRQSLPTLEVRDSATGNITASVELQGMPPRAYPLAFTPDLKLLAWADGDTLTVTTPARRWTASTPGLAGSRELIFSPDAATLVIPNAYGYVQFWDVRSGQRRATVLLRGRPTLVKFLPGGKLLAVNGPLSGHPLKYGELNIPLFQKSTEKAPFPVLRTFSATRSARFIYKINAVYLAV